MTFWPSKKSKLKKVLWSFCVVFHLVSEKKLKKFFLKKLWLLKIFRAKNLQFRPKEKEKKIF